MYYDTCFDSNFCFIENRTRNYYMVVGVYGHLQQFFSYILYIVTDGVKAWKEITN
jgi:hypothetical protein